MAQEARHRLAREVWLAREGAPVPWNLFQAPLQAARDPRVEAVLGVYNEVQLCGLQLPMMVGVEEQEDEEGQERVPHEIDQSSSGSSSSSSSDSSSSSSSSSDSSSSCSSTPDGLKQDWGREAEAQNRVRGSGGAGSPVHPGGVVPDGGDEERETTRSEEAQGVAGGEQGRDGVDGQGEEQDGPAGVPVRLLPRLTHSLTPRSFPGWILHGRKKSGLKSGSGVQSLARKELKSYPMKLVRRKVP